MKITISTNGKFTDSKLYYRSDGTISCIEFDFDPPSFGSDLEIWLNDSQSGKFLDYVKMNLSIYNKMRFGK